MSMASQPPLQPSNQPGGQSKMEMLRHDLQNVGSIIAAARGLIAKGQSINLQPLEREVKRLCDEIIKLPSMQNAPLRPVMVALIDDLDRLAGEMRARHAELQQQLKGLSERERATAAYGAPGAGRNTPRR